MAKKLIKKNKCTFEAGHIVKKNELVGIPSVVWYQLEKLEVMYQQYAYLKAQRAYCPGPSLDGFARTSALGTKLPYAPVPDTPVMDRRVEEAMAFMEEVDAVDNAKKLNDAIEDFRELIDWCASEKFVEGNCYNPIDTFELGDPLKLTADTVAYVLSRIVNEPVEIEG